MGFYDKPLQTVSLRALLGRQHDDGEPGSPVASGSRSNQRPDRLLRTPLVFETLEPRVLLSGDPISAAAQNAIIAGLQSFETWTANQLTQAAQLAQQMPVVSTSVGDLVNLPQQITTHLIQPTQAYFSNPGAGGATDTGLAAALAADPAETRAVLGQFAHGEFLIALSAYKTSTPITAPLNLTEDSGGVSLRIATPPTLSGNANVSMALTFGFDTGAATPTFFIQPTTITEGVILANASFNTTAALGAADATVTGGSAALNAAATVTLKDPLAGDPNNYITPAQLSSSPVPALVTAAVSGTASVTLPITSTLVAGGPQSLQLNWSGNLAGVGSSNLASLGPWAQLDTISPSLVHQAIAALPGLIQSAAGNSGFGASVPVLGQDLGPLFSFGTKFSDAAAAVASATTISQAATALQAHLGNAVTFTVNAANNELDMQVIASSPFSVSVPYTINQQVGGANFVLNGTLPVTGTASATISLALSFNTALSDANRLSVIETGSVLSLALDGVTASPIAATAALGLIRVTVNGGSLAVGSFNGSVVDPTKTATATVNFVNTGGGRVTLAQLTANPAASLAAPVYNGGINASLPLLGADGVSSAQVGMTWNLAQALSGGNPNVTGSARAAALNVARSSLLTPAALGAPGAAGLALMGQWATAISTAAGGTGALATSLPLLGASL